MQICLVVIIALKSVIFQVNVLSLRKKLYRKAVVRDVASKEFNASIGVLNPVILLKIVQTCLVKLKSDFIANADSDL